MTKDLEALHKLLAQAAAELSLALARGKFSPTKLRAMRGKIDDAALLAAAMVGRLG